MASPRKRAPKKPDEIKHGFHVGDIVLWYGNSSGFGGRPTYAGRVTMSEPKAVYVQPISKRNPPLEFKARAGVIKQLVKVSDDEASMYRWLELEPSLKFFTTRSMWDRRHPLSDPIVRFDPKGRRDNDPFTAGDLHLLVAEANSLAFWLNNRPHKPVTGSVDEEQEDAEDDGED